MKKCFFGAIAVLALASCSNEKVVELSQDQAIKFTATTGKATSRAADGYCNNVKPGEFNVWASAQSKNYFANEAYKDNGSGTYVQEDDILRYWPESGTVSFFATKNENGTPVWTYDTPSLGFTGYTVEAKPAAQKDFIYAAALNVAKPAADAANKNVALNFRHALSQIEFQAKNQNSKIYVEIDEVKVVNVNSKGDFVISTSTTNNYQDHNLGDAADTDTRSGRCSWSEQSDKTSYTASFTAVKVGSGATSLTVTDATGEFNANTMYLLPQTLTAWDQAAGAAKAAGQANSYFIVKALIYNVAGETVSKDNDVVVWGKNTGTEETPVWATKEIAIPVPASTTWEDGKRYVYTFVFTTTGNGGYDPDYNTPVLTPITLEVTVDDFVDAGNKDKDVEMK
ncbi:MAG: fimbrillin family protein [Muribaculaceae bacterium]